MKNKTKIYIAGPMSGLINFNRMSFAIAERRLNQLGYQVINPACLPLGWQYSDYTTVTLAMLSVCDEIVFLPGSLKSKGAQIELDYAIKHGIKIVTPVLKEILPLLKYAYDRVKVDNNGK